MNFIRLYCRRFRVLRLSQSAAGMAVISLLAFVPLLALMLMLSHLIPPFDVLTDAFATLAERTLVPHDAGQAADYIRDFKQRAAHSAAGVAMVLGLVFLLARSLEQTFNHIWRVRGRRRAHKSLLLYLALLAFPLAAGAAFIVEDLFPHGSLPRIATGWLMLVAALWLLYRFVPACPVRNRHALIGAAAASVLLEAAQALFAAYLDAFPAYNNVYGVFAAFPLFILWFNLMWLLVLSGALLAALWPQRRPEGKIKSRLWDWLLMREK